MDGESRPWLCSSLADHPDSASRALVHGGHPLPAAVEGSSLTRGMVAVSCAGASPSRVAAVSRAASVGSPTAVQSCPPRRAGLDGRVIAQRSRGQQPGDGGRGVSVQGLAVLEHLPVRAVTGAADHRLIGRGPQPPGDHAALGQGAGLIGAQHPSPNRESLPRAAGG